MHSGKRRKHRRLRCHSTASLRPLTTANLALPLISCSHRPPFLAGLATRAHPAPALEVAGRSGRSTVPPRSPPRLDQRHLGWQAGRKIKWTAPRRQSGLGGLRAQSLLLTEFYLLWGSSCQGRKEKRAHPTVRQQLPSKTDSEPCHQITQKTQHSNLHCRDHPTRSRARTHTHTGPTLTFTPQSDGYYLLTLGFVNLATYRLILFFHLLVSGP